VISSVCNIEHTDFYRFTVWFETLMTTVATLTLQSGDRARLDDVVAELKGALRRKGIDFSGPHQSGPTTHHVSQYSRLDGDSDRSLSPWAYTVYTRRMEITGQASLAQTVLKREFPDSVYIEAEVETIQHAGGR